MQNKINVILVEDNSAYRKAVTRSLSLETDLELTGEFGSAEAALRRLQDLSAPKAPDVVLLDLNLSGMSGLKAIPWFNTYTPNARIIVLTQSDNEADVLKAISSGASGYMLKSATLEQLHDGVRTVFAGGSTLDSGVARFIINKLKDTAAPATDEISLSDRELEVLSLISKGLVKKEVAERLGISPRTVAIHATHIYEKLHVPNAPSAVAKAYQTGLLPPKNKS